MVENRVQIEKIAEIHRIEINGQVILVTSEELEKLCIELEEYLFDEPTYEELSKRVLELELDNERLVRGLRCLQDIEGISSSGRF